MSDPDTTPLSPQLANIQNSLYSAIQFSKKQQWAITNYVILVYAAIFGLSRALKDPVLSVGERGVFVGLIAVAGLYAIFLLIQIQRDLGTYREQLEAFHIHTISEKDRKKYQLTPITIQPCEAFGSWPR